MVAENAIRDEVYRYLSSFSTRNSLEKSRSRGSQDQDRKAPAPAPTAPSVPPTQEAAPEGVTPIIDNDENDEWIDEPATDKSSTDAEGKRRAQPSSPRRRRIGKKTSIHRSALDTTKGKKRTNEEAPSSPSSPMENITPPVLSRVGSSAGFQRTDSISSIKTGDRLGRLRYHEGSESPHMVRSRDSSPGRNVRFAAELSRPPSRPDTPHNEPDSPHTTQAPHAYASHPHSSNSSPYPTQRASVLKSPLKR